MMNTIKTLHIAAGAISFLTALFGLITVIVWVVTGHGVLEYPEKDLLAICIASLAVTAVSNGMTNNRRIMIGALSLSVIIGLFAMVTKTIVFFFAEDGDIAQWHIICSATGALLLVTTTSTWLKKQQEVQPSRPA